jgi:hypothetical protein
MISKTYFFRFRKGSQLKLHPSYEEMGISKTLHENPFGRKKIT